MNDNTPVVFIGSGEASVLERKTLIYSIRKHAQGEVRIVVFNGTHNSVEMHGMPPEPAPMSLRAKYQNITEFSNYRFLIPQLCGFSGRAIYLDSDMICLGDINELFQAPMGGAALLGKPFTGPRGDQRWGFSVALYDCSQCRFELDCYVEEMTRGLYAYNDLHQMTSAFLAHHPFQVDSIDPRWNEFDRYDVGTKLIHYTNLYTQPWKFRGHQFGGLWFRYLREARDAGDITDDDIELAIRRGYVRPDLSQGNTIGVVAVARNALSDLRAALRDRKQART